MISIARFWSLLTGARRTLVYAASGAMVLFATGAEAGPPKTVEAGKLNVALNGDMPMTGIKDGKLIGTDGELMNRIAANLGLEVVPQLMEWSAEIQSTKQGKVDIMHGMMGWIEARSKVMLLTDPIYYSGTFVVQKKSNNFSTVEDMKGRSVATVSGFTLVPELKTVEGIGEVKLYDTTDAALRDVLVGRADMAILDPPLIEYAIRQNPDWDIHQLALEPRTGEVSDPVDQVQHHFRHQSGTDGASRCRQRRDREDLGGLCQRRVDEELRDGRSELVHPARSQPENRG